MAGANPPQLRIPYPLRDLDELNRRAAEADASNKARLDALENPPLAQMSSLNIDPGITINAGGSIKPYVSAWQRGMSADFTNGTLTIERGGVYIFSASFSGEATSANSDIFFGLRLNGVVEVVLESSLKQKAEGVQANLGGFARLPAGGVIDVVVTSNSQSSVTLTNLVLSAGYYSSLDNVIITAGAARFLLGSGEQLTGGGAALTTPEFLI